MRLEKVTFLIILWLACSCGMIVYSVVSSSWPKLIAATGLLAWNAASILILLIMPGSRIIRGVAISGIAALVVLLPRYEFSTDRFAAELDRVTLCGPQVALDDCAVAAQTAGLPAVPEEPGGALSGVRVKPSSVAKGCYFFLTVFLVLWYYGRVYGIWHENRARTRTSWALDDSVISNLVIIASLSVSSVIGLFFAGADLPSLGLFSGLVAAGVSIALRDILQNSVAGMLLLWDKTVKKDDVITVNGNQYGWIDRITLRYTLIKDRNDIHTLVPNSTLISSTIQNWTQTNNEVRLKLDIGVAYGTNIEEAQSCLVRAARKVKRVLKTKTPMALVISTGDSCINLQLRFWINDAKEGIRNVLSQVYIEILKEFKNAHPEIVIPFPQHDIRIIPSEDAARGEPNGGG